MPISASRLVAEFATRRRFGLDVRTCEYTATGPHFFSDTRESAPVYMGRIGLTDAAGSTLLVDWRSPAVEPFFAASLADPRGVSYRRRHR
ncbi:DNA helicase IV [Dietzia sp. 2505]